MYEKALRLDPTYAEAHTSSAELGAAGAAARRIG